MPGPLPPIFLIELNRRGAQSHFLPEWASLFRSRDHRLLSLMLLPRVDRGHGGDRSEVPFASYGGHCC